jgi:hypothetical protein
MRDLEYGDSGINYIILGQFSELRRTFKALHDLVLPSVQPFLSSP